MRTSLLALLPLVALAADAHAQDRKHYPGNMCRVASTSYFDNDGRVANTAATSQKFECPIIRDNVNIQRTWVYYKDLSATDGVKCRLKTGKIDDASGTAYWFEDAASGNADVNSTPAYLTFVDQPNIPDGYYSLRCYLPGVTSAGQSAIVKYLVAEVE